MEQQIEDLFRRKTEEAARIVNERTQKNDADVQNVPFEVNTVLKRMNQETRRREKLLKRKPV